MLTPRARRSLAQHETAVPGPFLVAPSEAQPQRAHDVSTSITGAGFAEPARVPMSQTGVSGFRERRRSVLRRGEPDRLRRSPSGERPGIHWDASVAAGPGLRMAKDDQQERAAIVLAPAIAQARERDHPRL